ncbi:SCO5717 family growth-regulating ATPase, partial [Streptomyces sp. T-3]|nr:SCO5717 family growth-regulating ATPase [Streptomyces sp. T-3]
MNRDRSEYRGGQSPDGDDRELDLTGEFEIVYEPPAWYDQSSQGGSGQWDTGQASAPPPTGPPLGPPGGTPQAPP